MNLTILSGRLTKDPELVNAGEYQKCDFSLAVNKIKGEGADFMECTAWNKQAENLVKYMRKGSQVLIRGSLQINRYEAKDGTKRKDTRIVCEQIEFLGSRSDTREAGTEEVNPPKENGYQEAMRKGKEETKAMFEKQNDVKKLDKLFEETSHICSDNLPF